MSNIVYKQYKTANSFMDSPPGNVIHYNSWGGEICYLKDNKPHHETTSAINVIDSFEAYYYLNGEYFGDEKDFTDETWTKFVIKYKKLVAFR